LSSAATLGAAASSQFAIGCDASSGTTTINCGYEGVYTDRFTYHPNDAIYIFASLVSPAQVDVSIARLDLVPSPTVATYPILPTNNGNTNSPGQTGAMFSPVLVLSAGGFAPGLYQVSIPSSAMEPANRIDSSNGFPSDNSVSYFVVTPQVAGSLSPILWLLDSLTGTAYGSYAGASIYPGSAGLLRTVNWLRPGQDRDVYWGGVLPLMQQNYGYAFEYQDLIDLAAAPSGYLNAYNLVCIVGQFEYIPHEVMLQLQSYLAGGGNILSASHEFGAFRVRLDQTGSTLTTYKWDYAGYDPYYLSGDPTQAPYVAGIGMCSPASPYETEIIGQTVWAAQNAAPDAPQDMPLYNLGEAGWILEGTGLAAGDVLPQALPLANTFASGCCLQFDASNQPYPILTDEMRMPAGTVVWAALPSSNAQDWTQNAGLPAWEWPSLASGYATATLHQQASGAQVVSFPSGGTVAYNANSPVYAQMLLNIFQRLSSRSAG